MKFWLLVLVVACLSFAPLLVVVSLCACSSHPAEPAAPPAPPSDVVRAADNACANLRSPAVNCPEGFGGVGGESCTTIVARREMLHALPLDCWTKASNAAEAKGCGSLRCIH